MKRLLVISCLCCSPIFVAAPATAGVLYLKACAYYSDRGDAYQSWYPSTFTLGDHCSQGGTFEISAASARAGDVAQWHTIAPPSIEIIAAYTPLNQVLIDSNISSDGYTATFFWNGGTQKITPSGHCCNSMDYGVGINRTITPSRWFGWQVRCNGSCSYGTQVLGIRGIDLEAVDTAAPTIAPTVGPNLWNQAGHWVRGTWQLGFTATADDGVCSISAQVGPRTVAGPTEPPPNQGSWTQCQTPVSMSSLIDTTQFPNGSLPLRLTASDAASPANTASPSGTVDVDNTPVGLSLSGPTDVASTTAGPAYVTATAVAGPSGVYGIDCSVDGGSARWYLASTARIPVQGYGEHQVGCSAANNALDSNGAAAFSPAQTFELDIRQPTVTTAAFEKIVDRLHCVRRREVVTIPAHWTTGRVGRRRVHVRVPAERRRLTVSQCRPRIVLRRVRSHGRLRVTRSVVLPHLAHITFERVAYGARTTLRGWIGGANGVGLGGQPIEIETAPANGSPHFSPTAATTSHSDGSWSLALPPGPSRLVEAVYAGTATTEPAMSNVVRISVPAHISLRIRPRQTQWGKTIVIQGRLAGGFIPPGGEAVVLWIGWRGGSTEIGHVYAHPNGHFQARYTFLRGNGTEQYRIWASSVRESGYPFAPSASAKVELTVT